MVQSDSVTPDEPGAYLCARVQAAIAGDDSTGELAVDVYEQDGVLVLSGTVATDERRQLVETVARANAPGCDIRNDLAIVELTAPQGTEPV